MRGFALLLRPFEAAGPHRPDGRGAAQTSCSATDFRLTKLDRTNVTFESPAHDFPKMIRYTLKPENVARDRERCRRSKAAGVHVQEAVSRGPFQDATFTTTLDRDDCRDRAGLLYVARWPAGRHTAADRDRPRPEGCRSTVCGCDGSGCRGARRHRPDSRRRKIRDRPCGRQRHAARSRERLRRLPHSTGPGRTSLAPRYRPDAGAPQF